MLHGSPLQSQGIQGTVQTSEGVLLQSTRLAKLGPHLALGCRTSSWSTSSSLRRTRKPAAAPCDTPACTCQTQFIVNVTPFKVKSLHCRPLAGTSGRLVQHSLRCSGIREAGTMVPGCAIAERHDRVKGGKLRVEVSFTWPIWGAHGRREKIPSAPSLGRVSVPPADIRGRPLTSASVAVL